MFYFFFRMAAKRTYRGSMPFAKRRRILQSFSRRTMIRPETKYLDNVSTGVSSFFITRALNPSVGTGRNNRIGNKIQLLAVDFTALNTNIAGSWRVTVLIPKDPSAGTGIGNGVVVRYDQDDYTILYDQVFSCVSDNIKRIRVPLNMIQEYSSTSLACVKNNVAIVINADTASNLTIASRLYFHDY